MKKIKSLLVVLAIGGLVLTGCGSKSTKHVHKYGDLNPMVDSTCYSEGHEAYYQCSGCGKYFDENKNEIPEPVVIPMKDHNYGAVQVSWNSGSATASVACQNDGCTHVETETKDGHFVEDTPATCTDPQRGHYEVTFDNELLGSARTGASSVDGAEALGHEYGEVAVQWNGISATATRICSRDADHVVSETKDGHFVEDTPATCMEPQKGHYEVTFNDSQFGSARTEANSVTGAEALGHDYAAATVVWNGISATATRVCSHDASHVLTETKEGHFVEDTPATCTEPQKGHYEVTFDNELLGSARTEANSVTGNPALDHVYGEVTVQWNGISATATRVCSRDADHVVSETKDGHFVEDTPATCMEPQKGHYEVTFNDSQFGSARTEANSVTGAEALGHDYAAATVVWNGISATATRVCSHDASHVLTETKEGHFVEDTPATCTEPQKGHYEVTFDNELLGSASTGANSVEGTGALGHDFQPSVSASSAIGYKAIACSRCGELNGMSSELMAIEDVDFTVNKFDAHGGKWGAQVISAHVLEHENTTGGTEEQFYLPKIDFTKYKVVTFIVSGRSDWDTRIGLASGDYAFPYAYIASPYSGELSFVTNGNQVNVRFVCGSTVKTATITNSDIINGEESVSLYMVADNAYRGAKVELTGLYSECPHNFVAGSEIGNTVCSICGEVGDTPMTVSDVDFTANIFGAKLMNGSSDVSGWGGGYNGGNKLNAYAATSLAYAYYGWGIFDLHLPRIDFRQYSEVTFTLGNTQANADDPTGNAAGFRIGFESGSTVVFASSWDNAEVTNGKLTFTSFAGKVLAQISSFGAMPDTRYEITDPDIISGSKSVVLYAGGYLNDSTSYAILLTVSSLSVEDSLMGMTKVADCAGNDTFTGTSVAAPYGFTQSHDRTGVGAGQTFYFKNIDISNYDTLVFGVYMSKSSLYLFSGNNAVSINIWGPRWVFVKLVKNQDGTWDSYYKEYHMMNGAWTAKIGGLSATNLNALVTVNWDGVEDATLAMTELYAK